MASIQLFSLLESETFAVFPLTVVVLIVGAPRIMRVNRTISSNHFRRSSRGTLL
jgi:hypothetical protein